MFRKCAVATVVNVLVTTSPFAQDAKTVVANASKAMGADSLRSVQYTGAGYDFAFGQAYSPTSPWPKFTVKSYTRSIDFERPASQATRLRMQFENPPRGGGQQPLGGEQTQNQTIIVGPNTPWAQQLEILVTPHGFLKAAATRPATVRTQTTGGKRYTVVPSPGDKKRSATCTTTTRTPGSGSRRGLTIRCSATCSTNRSTPITRTTTA